ncbi:MAG TPA: flagellar biosynthesis protein FlhB [Candidatus Hydrogenedentes bacterium]|nr:flagellar biosynthesis protein FlhB [Candidatus Hydrogenedentota bacterium]
MAEDTGGEKTLPASPQKKQRAREEGNIARSQDLTSGVALGAALLALVLLAHSMQNGLVEAMRYYMGNADRLRLDEMPLMPLTLRMMLDYGLAAVPIMLALLAVGLAVNLAQVGVIFTAKPIQPKFERLNFISGMKKFFTVRSLIELAKSILKLTFAVWVVWLAVRSRLPDFIALMNVPPEGLSAAVGALVVAVWWRIALAMIVIGIFDYGYQYWQHERDLRMTREEAKQELREMEGDPHIKRRIRQIQRQIAMKRMMAEVPKADVIITNPTEFAVALRYDMNKMNAPVVIAKGQRLLAQRIRELGEEHKVPIVQKPELARVLFKTVELNQAIPETLFHAVAEVLSFVYGIDRRAEKIRERQWLMQDLRTAV